MTKISTKDRTLQRTQDQFLEGFAQDRVQQRFVEQNIVSEMIEQLEEVPKMMSQSGTPRRTAEQIVDLPGPVLSERISERICEQWGVIEVTKISSQDQNLQQIFDNQVDESSSQVMEESFEVDKFVLPERPSERICEQSRVIDVTKISR